MRAALLLPGAGRFAGQPLSDPVAAALGRAQRMGDGAPGRRAQLGRHFRLVPDHWPVAALTRDADAGDAAGSAWLRADPCHVRPDINGARLLAVGDALALDAADVEALLPALRPLFGDAGVPIDAPVPARWYLRLPHESKWPAFSSPDDALGADLFEHLPLAGDARRWRSLLSEAQVVLHNHPWNAQRAARGLPVVNSLWFWGGGVLPDHVESPHSRYSGDDETGIALAHAAGILGAPQQCFASGEADAVYDLATCRDLAALERDWLQPALSALRSGDLQELWIDTADGLRWSLARGQRWRWWRRPRPDFAG